MEGKGEIVSLKAMKAYGGIEFASTHSQPQP